MALMVNLAGKTLIHCLRVVTGEKREADAESCRETKGVMAGKLGKCSVFLKDTKFGLEPMLVCNFKQFLHAVLVVGGIVYQAVCFCYRLVHPTPMQCN